MNFQERFPSDDDIWSYSNPTVAQQNAFKNENINTVNNFSFNNFVDNTIS